MGALRSSVRLVFWLLRPEQLLAGRVPVCADLVSTTSASWAAAAPGFDVAVGHIKCPWSHDATKTGARYSCVRPSHTPMERLKQIQAALSLGTPRRRGTWPNSASAAALEGGLLVCNRVCAPRHSVCAQRPKPARPPARPRASKSAAPCLPRRTVRRAGRSRDSDLPRCGRAGHPDCGRVLRG